MFDHLNQRYYDHGEPTGGYSDMFNRCTLCNRPGEFPICMACQTKLDSGIHPFNIPIAPPVDDAAAPDQPGIEEPDERL